MAVLAATIAVFLAASSTGTATLGTDSSGDAARLAATGGFLLGNAHRCGIATDRVVRTGRLIQELIVAASRDDQEQQEATERFAKVFMATAVPDKSDASLVPACSVVSSEFSKLENHRVADTAKPADRANNATGETAAPHFRLGDGE